ncbi:cation:proton antiporter [candidate division KSB1 bacterium]|nr:cation:proton antiporter [candidate division KSB1 bacterium]
MHLSLLVLLFGGLIVAAILLKTWLSRIGIPPMIGYLALGLALRIIADQTGMLSKEGEEVVHFLAQIGVITLLFRVGLESHLSGLLKQLRSASFIWIFNIIISGAIGYAAAYYLLGLPFLSSLVIAVAMTATSVGIPAKVWSDEKKLDTPQGELFLDVAELDDVSGVVLMSLLFSILPVLQSGSGDGGLLAVTMKNLGLFVLKLVGFAGACFLFSNYLEERFTGYLRKKESGPDLMLVVAGTGVVIAAVAGLLGFSAAIGAFFAGLAFSRDPQRVKVDAAFSSIYDLFTPFFFIGIAMRMAPSAMSSSMLLALLVLLIAAVAGKIIGTCLPAWRSLGTAGALLLGVSMIPRAEITMLIMQRAHESSGGVISENIYSAMILVSAITCVTVPFLLRRKIQKLQTE